MSIFSSRSSESQKPFLILLFFCHQVIHSSFFLVSPLKTPSTPGISGSIGSSGVFHRWICPRCKKPETARTAGRSGRGRGAVLSPALSPASLSSVSPSLGKRPKSRIFPQGGVHGRPAAESRTQRLTRGNTALHLHLRGCRTLLCQIIRTALLQTLPPMLLTVGVHLGNEQSLFSGLSRYLKSSSSPLLHCRNTSSVSQTQPRSRS